MTAPIDSTVPRTTGPYHAPFAPPLAPPTRIPFAQRISAVDVLRGLAVVLMAIDHVRVYSGLPAGGPTPGIFFTRWITHFVAPVFVFLAGTGAYFHGRKVGHVGTLSRFLVTRGLLLVLLELTVIRVSWTFNFDFGTYLLAGVIWVIGWSMVIMGALVHLPLKGVAAIGLTLVFGHNLLPVLFGNGTDVLPSDTWAWLWKALYAHGDIQLGAGPSLVVLYVLIPWLGVMASGYAFGALYELDEARRRRLLYAIGAIAVTLFVVLRWADVYGDTSWRATNPDGAWNTARAFLNTSKYPASLLFLLMTLGPAVLLLPALERTRHAATRTLEVFGRVPMFYYLLHIPLIHALACVVSLARTGTISPWLFGNHPMWPPELPPGYQWSLALLYVVTVVAVGLLYVACRWYAHRKTERPAPWMKYI